MPLADKIIRLTLQYGQLEEKQLVSRWQADLSQFLAPFEKDIISGHHGLEVGLEAGLVLKVVIKRRRFPPAAGLLRLANQLPEQLAKIAVDAASTGKDFHVGIRINPENTHRELYVYSREGISPALPLALPQLPDALRVTALGIDERQGISAYCTSQDNFSLIEKLRPQHLALNTYLKTDLDKMLDGMWLHFRLQEGKWKAAKFGLEYKSIPLATVTRVLSQFKLPYFNYLVPRQPLREMVIGGQTDSPLRSCYFSVA